MSAYTEGDILLKIDNVSKSYGDKLVLQNVSATIKDIQREGFVTGQIVAFLGPSGAGKTTLFRIMAGLDKPTSGSVVLDHEDHPVHAGEVGVVAQSYPLFAHRTVYSNLMLAASKRMAKPEAEIWVKAAIMEYDLFDQRDSYPAQLSGGQRQRAAILQQIGSGATYLLMDEPFSGLDIVAKKKTIGLIQRVANLTEKNTVIVVTHDIPAAVAVADHIWLLGRNRGADGRPIPGAFIVETINLAERGLCWHPDIETLPEFGKVVSEIGQRFATL